MSTVSSAPREYHWNAGLGREIIEPAKWAFDGNLTRREPVLDPNSDPPRVVRHVGWRKCLRCREAFWTPSVIAVRLCDTCKLAQAEPPSKSGPKQKPGPKVRINFGNGERRS
jgi:hypothetical protein